MFLGVDVGSISVNTVVMDSDRRIIEEHYTRTQGRPFQCAREVLEEVFTRYPAETFTAIATTGSGGKVVAEAVGGRFTNEVSAQAEATGFFHPEVRTIVEMGGEDAKLIMVAPYQDGGRTEILDFAMNSMCAAGTGSFLDQQASRLNLTIEEFGEIALKTENPPRVAGRCSVFAKSDMIHLQQIATPDYEIVAGLCFAVARNFKACIGRGKMFVRPISFQGGVAANRGMRRAFEEVLGLDRGELVIPEHYASMGAIGSVLLAIEDGVVTEFRGLDGIERHLESAKDDGDYLEPLHQPKCPGLDWSGYRYDFDGENVTGYLGIDVGSISTNVVIIDEHRQVIARRYLMTAGRPIDAVRQGLAEVAEEVGDRVIIRGAGSTGSGRYLTGEFIGADVIRNEITAQATAAAEIDPEVDTIFEIGGQDSKFISLRNGAVVDFEMNKVCAAGTGSFLEEQAERLNISIREEFGDLALSSPRPVSLGERCTVFMESDLIHQQHRGAPVDDLVAGLSYSIVYNYLNRVVGDKKIGNKIFFQGGTAANRAVVAAFEKVRGSEVIVPPHHDVTGAIGAAILAQKACADGRQTTFKGFGISTKQYKLRTFECQDCPNMCEIREVTIEGEKPLFYGSRCEKYDVDKAEKKRSEFPNLFAFREKLLTKCLDKGDTKKTARGTIGIPRLLAFHELMPLWITFFQELGYKVALSDRTNRNIIHRGVEAVVAEPCFPVKVAHGHILDLVEKGVKNIFAPSIVNLYRSGKEGKDADTYNCPYVQSLPYVLRATFDFDEMGVNLISPVVYLGNPVFSLKKSLRALGKELGVSAASVKAAWRKAQKAQREFYDTLKAKGRDVLESLPADARAMVIIARPYNGCDPGINLGLPQKLLNLGALPIPLDMLPVDEHSIQPDYSNVYWKAGQRFLQAAELIRNEPRLFPIYITNFGCGPDSFVTHFFRDAMAGKPFLQIEIDEHSADAGAITRLEAYLDSLENYEGDGRTAREAVPDLASQPSRAISRKIYVPYMCDHARLLVAAFQAFDVDAELMPESTPETMVWGKRYTTGKECYPCHLTIGDMLRVINSKGFDRSNSAFMMPGGTGPCRFGCYNRLQRLVLDELGYSDIPVFSPVQNVTLYEDLGIIGTQFDRLVWRSVVVSCLIEKKLLETRPYEVNRGQTDAVYEEAMGKLCDAVRNRAPVEPVLDDAFPRFGEIPVDMSEPRPVIGVVGEIYVRSNPFSNEHAIRQIEELGGEVRFAPFTEWIYYINTTGKQRARALTGLVPYWKLCIKDVVQHRDDRRISARAKHLLRHDLDPSVSSTIRAARDYVHRSFEGETILSVGRTVEFFHEGADGVVNLLPFTCMPGNIVSALMKRVRQDHNDMPVLNIAFEGHEQTSTRTRLEAFIFQARAFQRAKSKTRGGKH